MHGDEVSYSDASLISGCESATDTKTDEPARLSHQCPAPALHEADDEAVPAGSDKDTDDHWAVDVSDATANSKIRLPLHSRQTRRRRRK